ncbi:MAG: Asp23/Gls24 family envelope stress response protein [Solirubrobacteraceae bacterium]
MAEKTATEQAQTKPHAQGAGAADGERSSPLQGERGSTTIADSVVNKVAGIAAREVPGVYQLGGGASRALGSVTDRLGIGEIGNQGVSVEVGERQAAVDLTLVIEYGESIPHITQQVRNHIIKRVEGITGLEVIEVNIAVDDLHFPGDDISPGSGPESGEVRVS